MSKRKKERILLIRRMIFIIFAICWMMVIFHFSSKNADESTKDSNAAGMLVGRIVYSDFNTNRNKSQIKRCAHQRKEDKKPYKF